VAFSTYLTYVELFTIEAVCQWCVASALVITSIAVLATIRAWREPVREPPRASLQGAMSLYTKDSIDRVKDAVDMVQLVGARSDLRRVGARWIGLCPFHDERTPSFSVNAEHKLYHCFGCGESGDAIRFVEATEALDFREAV